MSSQKDKNRNNSVEGTMTSSDSLRIGDIMGEKYEPDNIHSEIEIDNNPNKENNYKNIKNEIAENK